MNYEDEITVELNASLEYIKNNYKVINEYDINDIYIVDKNIDLNEDYLKILSKCVLIRDIIKKDKPKKTITYKYKKYNDKMKLEKQGSIDCLIDSIENAKMLFEAINFKELIHLNDHLIVYTNGKDEFALQIVNNKHIYIEIESECKITGNIYNSIDEMKNVIKKLNIPLMNDNYFVRKALNEMVETLNKK